MSECRCGRETRDDAYVCEHCCDQLSIALGDVPWIDEELEVTITKQRGIPTEGGSPGAEKALPWHEKAAEARRNLRALLVSWVRFCDDEQVRNQSPRPPSGPRCEKCWHKSCERIKRGDMPDDTIAAMSRWMMWRVDGLALHDIGPEAHDEITDAVAECRRLIDRRPERWYAGPCDECNADLYARARQGRVSCHTEGCGATYDVAERRDWLLSVAEDRLATVGTVARAVSWLGAEPLTKHRVGMWAKRGRILAKGHDGQHPLYRIGDAIDLLAAESVNMEVGERSAP